MFTLLQRKVNIRRDEIKNKHSVSGTWAPGTLGSKVGLPYNLGTHIKQSQLEINNNVLDYEAEMFLKLKAQYLHLDTHQEIIN